jgi:hypothetical protein
MDRYSSFSYITRQVKAQKRLETRDWLYKTTYKGEIKKRNRAYTLTESLELESQVSMIRKPMATDAIQGAQPDSKRPETKPFSADFRFRETGSKENVTGRTASEDTASRDSKSRGAASDPDKNQTGHSSAPLNVASRPKLRPQSQKLKVVAPEDGLGLMLRHGVRRVVEGVLQRSSQVIYLDIQKAENPGHFRGNNLEQQLLALIFGRILTLLKHQLQCISACAVA